MPGADRLGRDFATFLGQARSVQTPHLRALLNLKQSPEEVGLPGFTDFRAAATSGDRARVEEILAEDSDSDRAKLVARLPTILREEVRAGDLPAARAIVDLAVSIGGMEPFESERRQVLTYAANTVALRRELGLLNPTAVLAAAHLVPAAARQHIYQPFVARFVDDELDDERRRSAGDALAPHASELSKAQLDLINKALAEGPLRDKFAVYRKFAEQAPDQIPPSAVRVALDSAEAPAEGEEQPSLLAHPDPLAIVTASLPDSGDVELGQRAVQLVLASVRAHTAMPRLAEELDLGHRLLDRLEGVGAEYWSQLLQEIAANWGAYPGEVHPQLVNFIAGFLPRAATDAQEQVPANVVALLFEDPGHGLAVFDQFDQVPEVFKAALLDRLVALGSDPNHWQAGTAALTKFAGKETPQRIAAVFSALIAGGHLDPAAQVLGEYDSQLRPQLTELADQAAPHLQERLNSGEPLPAGLVETLAEQMSPEQIASLAAAVAARLRDGAPENATELVASARARSKSRLRDCIASHSLDTLVNIDRFRPEVAPLLASVCADVAHLDSERQGQLATKLAEWLQAHPGQLSSLAQNVLTIEGLAAEPSKTLVEGLLDTERATDDPDNRRQLLGAAFHLKGKLRSHATTAVRKRMGELETGSDLDKEIAAEFAERLASSRD